MLKKALAALFVPFFALVSLPTAQAVDAESIVPREEVVAVMDAANHGLTAAYGLVPGGYAGYISDIPTSAAIEIQARILIGAYPEEDYTKVQPGIRYQIDSSGGLCTLAFQIGNSNSRTFATAGHCGEVGDTVSARINGEFKEIGKFTTSVLDGSTLAEGRDYAAIKINDGIAIDGAIFGENVRPAPSMSIAELNKVKPTLCKMGSVSGKTCGDFVSVTGQFVTGEFFSAAGDSGSPIYAQLGNGELVSVAMLSSSPSTEPSVTSGQIFSAAF